MSAKKPDEPIDFDPAKGLEQFTREEVAQLVERQRQEKRGARTNVKRTAFIVVAVIFTAVVMGVDWGSILRAVNF
jgi:hypothetical protein